MTICPIALAQLQQYNLQINTLYTEVITPLKNQINTLTQLINGLQHLIIGYSDATSTTLQIAMLPPEALQQLGILQNQPENTETIQTLMQTERDRQPLERFRKLQEKQTTIFKLDDLKNQKKDLEQKRNNAFNELIQAYTPLRELQEKRWVLANQAIG